MHNPAEISTQRYPSVLNSPNIFVLAIVIFICVVGCKNKNQEIAQKKFRSNVSKLFLGADITATYEDQLKYFRSHKDAKPLGNEGGWTMYPPLSALGPDSTFVSETGMLSSGDPQFRANSRVFAIPAYAEFLNALPPVISIAKADSSPVPGAFLSLTFNSLGEEPAEKVFNQIIKDFNGFPVVADQGSFDSSIIKSITFDGGKSGLVHVSIAKEEIVSVHPDRIDSAGNFIETKISKSMPSFYVVVVEFLPISKP